MENSIFLSPAVAGLMKRHFVEARLHTDAQNTMTAEQLVENRRLQSDLSGTKTNPYFVVVDPKTGEKLGEHGLSGQPESWQAAWVAFLQRMIAAAGRGL